MKSREGVFQKKLAGKGGFALLKNQTKNSNSHMLMKALHLLSQSLAVLLFSQILFTTLRGSVIYPLLKKNQNIPYLSDGKGGETSCLHQKGVLLLSETIEEVHCKSLYYSDIFVFLD